MDILKTKDRFKDEIGKIEEQGEVYKENGYKFDN
jgi:hypothetical protein